MADLDQNLTPIFDSLKKYKHDNVIPFHVPGHKQGRGLPEFTQYVGENVMQMDLTCLPDTDNISSATGVIRQSEDLAADLFGADRAFFLVNGTTYGIQTMIMTICHAGDKVILPRNVHKSALGALVLSGAVPVYIEPEIHQQYGIAMCVTPECVEQAILDNPDAKGIFLVYPIYYGLTADLEEICKIAHSHNMPVLVDEAHGAHLVFHPALPKSAIECGADIVASSTHKMIGSLTQSSMILMRGGLISPARVKAVMNLTQTTSPSYILMTSLELARKQMALHGCELLHMALAHAYRVRHEVNIIKGYRLLDINVINEKGVIGLDPLKITVNVTGLGISGYEMENILRHDYNIQVELSDLYNVIFLMTIADSENTVDRLIYALRDIAKKQNKAHIHRILPPLPAIPELVLTPREAFYSEQISVPFIDAVGEVCAESIMVYPPGIPLMCPGERITGEIYEYVQVLKRENADIQGMEDSTFQNIKIVKTYKEVDNEDRL